MHSENFQADFFLNGLRHTCNHQKHVTSTFSGVEMWFNFKYQHNEQKLQIWDKQICQTAKF